MRGTVNDFVRLLLKHHTNVRKSQPMLRKLLKHNLKMLRLRKKYGQYCVFLSSKIMSFIRAAYPGLVKEWEQEKQSYMKQVIKREECILAEINAVYSLLKSRLFEENLLNNPLIQKKCKALDSILAFAPEEDRVWALPPQQDIAFERFKDLFYGIVEAKGEALIEPYGASFLHSREYIIKERGETNYQCNDCLVVIRAKVGRAINQHATKLCPGCGNMLQSVPDYILGEMTVIEYFNEKTFVPSFFELRDLNNFFWNGPAGAWAVLCGIEWCWDIKNRDYFRKGLTYKTPQECRRSVNLLNLQHMRAEVRTIKKNGPERPSTLSRKKIDAYVTVLINKVYGECCFEDIPTLSGPEAVELELSPETFGDLRLKITWGPGITEICLLHSFHDADSTLKRIK